MHRTITVVYLLFFLGFNAQENTFQKKGNVKSDQEIYAEGRAEYSKVLIIPFEPKMYISSADKEIASRTKLTHQEIRENMRYGISNQIRHAVGKGMKSVSLLHIDTGAVGRDLGYIYNSIGYKYKPLPEEDIARNKQNEEDLKPVNKLKGSLNKLIKHDNLAPKESNGETRIKNGQIHSTVSYGEKFMNTSIRNPSLLKVLSAKYQADVFLFINELNIEAAAPASRSGLSTLSYKRKVKVHYTIFNKDGKELHGGAAIVYMPSTTNDMNKIINNYFPILAQNMSDNIPGAQTSKLDQQKLKEEERKAAEQREQIKKL